jgi:hypothetical protein
MIASIVILSLMLVGRASGDCLVDGDMMFMEGQSLGHVGLECLNSTSYDAFEMICGPPASNGTDGVVVEVDAVYTCSAESSYCVQCGPRGRGAALCLDSPDLPADCVGDDDADEDGTSDEPVEVTPFEDITASEEPVDDATESSEEPVGEAPAPAPAMPAAPSASSAALDRSALACVLATVTLIALLQLS